MLSTLPQYQFLSTIMSHGWYMLPPFHWDGETLTYSGCLLEEYYRVSMKSHPDGIALDTSTPAEIIPSIRWMLRLDDDLTAFYTICESEPALQHVPIQGWGRLLRSATIFEDVIKVITTTNTAWSGTIRMCTNLVNEFGEYGAFPTASQLANASVEDLKTRAGVGYRAAYIQSVAQQVASGELDLEALKYTTRDTNALYKFLRQLNGVGDYAAASLLMLLGRYAHVPIDSLAREMVSRHFYEGNPVTPAQIRQTFARFGEYAGLAYWCWKEPE